MYIAEQMLGKQVIVRTYSAGVHFGTMTQRNGREVLLTDARRLWYWEGAFTLSAVAMEGVKKTSKLSVAVPDILLTEAIEIIPCSETAARQISELKAYVAG